MQRHRRFVAPTVASIGTQLRHCAQPRKPRFPQRASPAASVPRTPTQSSASGAARARTQVAIDGMSASNTSTLSRSRHASQHEECVMSHSTPVAAQRRVEGAVGHEVAQPTHTPSYRSRQSSSNPRRRQLSSDLSALTDAAEELTSIAKKARVRKPAKSSTLPVDPDQLPTEAVAASVADPSVMQRGGFALSFAQAVGEANIVPGPFGSTAELSVDFSEREIAKDQSAVDIARRFDPRQVAATTDAATAAFVACVDRAQRIISDSKSRATGTVGDKTTADEAEEAACLSELSTALKKATQALFALHRMHLLHSNAAHRTAVGSNLFERYVAVLASDVGRAAVLQRQARPNSAESSTSPSSSSSSSPKQRVVRVRVAFGDTTCVQACAVLGSAAPLRELSDQRPSDDKHRATTAARQQEIDALQRRPVAPLHDAMGTVAARTLELWTRQQQLSHQHHESQHQGKGGPVEGRSAPSLLQLPVMLQFMFHMARHRCRWVGARTYARLLLAEIRKPSLQSDRSRSGGNRRGHDRRNNSVVPSGDGQQRWMSWIDEMAPETLRQVFFFCATLPIGDPDVLTLLRARTKELISIDAMPASTREAIKRSTNMLLTERGLKWRRRSSLQDDPASLEAHMGRRPPSQRSTSKKHNRHQNSDREFESDVAGDGNDDDGDHSDFASTASRASGRLVKVRVNRADPFTPWGMTLSRRCEVRDVKEDSPAALAFSVAGQGDPAATRALAAYVAAQQDARRRPSDEKQAHAAPMHIPPLVTAVNGRPVSSDREARHALFGLLDAVIDVRVARE